MTVQFLKMGKGFEHFTKESVEMTEHVVKYSIILVDGKTKLKRLTASNVTKDVQKLECSYTVGGSVKCYNHLDKGLAVFL